MRPRSRLLVALLAAAAVAVCLKGLDLEAPLAPTTALLLVPWLGLYGLDPPMELRRSTAAVASAALAAALLATLLLAAEVRWAFRPPAWLVAAMIAATGLAVYASPWRWPAATVALAASAWLVAAGLFADVGAAMAGATLAAWLAPPALVPTEAARSAEMRAPGRRGA